MILLYSELSMQRPIYVIVKQATTSILEGPVLLVALYALHATQRILASLASQI